MPIDFMFRSIDGRNLDGAAKFVASQNLGYPNYEAWVEKMRSELSLGIKYGIVAYSNGVIVGDIIFQNHKTIQGFLEIKNVRVHERLRGRDFASFLIKQAEVEMPCEAVVVDARLEQQDVIGLFSSQGYISIAQRPLYDSHNPDVVMLKPKNLKMRDMLVSSATALYN